MATDWRELSRVSLPSPARASSPSSSQSQPPQKNSLACERCFKRKQKCDRLRPACTSCADLGVECVARSQQFDFNGEDTTLTHARVNGYVASLRRRVAELEEKIKVAEQKHVQARPESLGTIDADTPINGKRRRSNYGSILSAPVHEQTAANGEEQSSVQDTMSAIGLLSNKAMAESRTNTGDKPHKLAIIESISAALAVDGGDPSKASSSQPVYVMDDQLIPLTRNLTLSPFHQFLDWSVWLPHIDENRLYEQYEAVLEMSDQGIDPAGTALPRFNTYLAVAIGISMSPDAGRLSSLASNLHAAAVKLLPFILHSQEPLDTLHCMLLLAVFSMFSASAAGLHKTVPPRNTSDTEYTYRVEWLFWSVFLWDRSLASVMGRPFTIAEVDISVTVPDITEDETTSGPVKNKLALSKHLITHAQLISDVLGSHQPSPLFSYSNLCFWREFPPQTGGTATPKRPQFDYLDQLACRALILMVKPKDQNLTSSEVDAESDSEVEADTISCCKALIEKLYSRSGSGTTVSFLDAYDILAAAVAYICLVQRTPQPNQTGLTQTFEVMSKASILLTQCSSKFSALGVFQQFLLTLSTKMMEGRGGLLNYQDLIPPEIPGHLRRIVQRYSSSVTIGNSL
ncbi:STB5-like transcription factor [Fusarium pseudocircinatum]|uniref:STB5-like transcription factor n=1 Tax=Fusarium pseudocircinatum TaxID=56676 RepID=A0A8H5NSW0_9HYPO|nr:STB5-like transcription factor [Fusarium pseudocircinatum]